VIYRQVFLAGARCEKQRTRNSNILRAAPQLNERLEEAYLTEFLTVRLNATRFLRTKRTKSNYFPSI